ncbi:MAG: tetratricopeptide repeat protein [Candidatus Aminicenantes bacterium]|nr:tetratricopeptide repeat protein [Candidatus Aminicenantes bacterium]
MGILKKIFSQNPEKHEQKGDTFFNNSDWGRAKIEYENALNTLEKTSSGCGESEARLQGKLRQAREGLALEHSQTAETLMEQAYYDDARDLFQLAIDLAQDPELISTIENRMLEMERLTARDVQTDISDLQVNDEGVSDEQGDEYFIALCGTLPEEVRAVYFSYGETFKSGYLALNRGEFALAADCFARAMKENPSPDSFIPLELATAYMNLEKFDEAHQLLETFLQYHPDALPGYQLLCEVFWETRAFDQAEALLADCPDELKNSSAYYLLRGEAMFQSGNYSEATSFYQDFMKEYGWNELIARALARTFEILGDFENARDMYAKIMDQCRGCHTRIDPFVKRKFADISFDLGQHSSAMLEMYLSLAQEDPENNPFYFQRVSRIYASLGNEEEARRFQLFAQQAQNGKE